MAEVTAELARHTIPAEFGGHTARAAEADVLVVSPGVPSETPLVRDWLREGKPVVSELEVASWFWEGPIVGITGTNGKTTTTALTGRMFTDARVPSVVAGNIGNAFSAAVREGRTDRTAVLEVSSFQLDHVDSFRPGVAVLLNITPDHLDRYGNSFEAYRAAKSRIFLRQEAGDTLVYNADDPIVVDSVRQHAPDTVRMLPFSLRTPQHDGMYMEGGGLIIAQRGTATRLVWADDVTIRGSHNMANAMAAVLAAHCLGISAASIRATLRNFKGVEHRLETIRELDGVVYVNDSKATNVDAVWYALESVRPPIVLLLGGRDKGNDYTRLVERVRNTVRAIVAIGESSGNVRSAFEGVVPITVVSTMADAVAAARRLARRGDTVLLSPACASFDWFQNFEHRGKVFRDLVMDLRIEQS
jgi:UDP-N-acetylmuramoylalanine--D-glutamate ligase